MGSSLPRQPIPVFEQLNHETKVEELGIRSPWLLHFSLGVYMKDLGQKLRYLVLKEALLRDPETSLTYIILGSIMSIKAVNISL